MTIAVNQREAKIDLLRAWGQMPPDSDLITAASDKVGGGRWLVRVEAGRRKSWPLEALVTVLPTHVSWEYIL